MAATPPSFVADFLAFLPPGLHPGMDALARGLSMGVVEQGGLLRVRLASDQEQAIADAVQEGVATMIFIFVTDPLAPADAIQMALAQGLKVYTIHRPLYPVTASLLVPNFYQGTLLAHRLAQAMNDTLSTAASAGRPRTVAILGGPKILDDEELVLGCLDGLKRIGVIVVNDPMVDTYRNLTDIKGGSYHVMDALMQDCYYRYTKNNGAPFDGLVVFNDETLHDVVAYLQQKNLIGKFPIVSRNGSPAAIDWVRKDWTSATMDYGLPELGRMAAQLITTRPTDNPHHSPCDDSSSYVMGPIGKIYDAANVDQYVSWDVRAPVEVELLVVGTADTTSSSSSSVPPEPCCDNVADHPQQRVNTHSA
jgi:ABC-type sugar transport system substrate-binding protein